MDYDDIYNPNTVKKNLKHVVVEFTKDDDSFIEYCEEISILTRKTRNNKELKIYTAYYNASKHSKGSSVIVIEMYEKGNQVPIGFVLKHIQETEPEYFFCKDKAILNTVMGKILGKVWGEVQISKEIDGLECPHCESINTEIFNSDETGELWECLNCGKNFEVFYEV